MQKDLPPAIFLLGPTASGKTQLAIELVRKLPCDIISVDSVLIYRGMDIGTAKPDPETLAAAPHRLIDICDPAEAYSVARFRQDALREMANITATGRIPLLVGGTMLYFRALQQGLSALPAADPAVRIRLQQEARIGGWARMHRKLQEVDPIAASRIHPNDPQRIQRALEVYALSGVPISQLQAKEGSAELPYRVVKLVRTPRRRELLHERIESRFHRMLEQGFEGEVRTLLARGDLVPEMPSMRAVGYRQMIRYLFGDWDRETMMAKGITATRQLAKRQLTWLRSEPDSHWLDEEAGNLLDQTLKIIAGATK